VLMPETVFFKDDSKIDFMTTLDREGCLAYDTKKKMNNNSMLSRMGDLRLDRQKDNEKYGRTKITVKN